MSKKLHAKEMKQDLFRATVARWAGAVFPVLQRHQRRIVIAILALVVLVILASVVAAWRDSHEAEAHLDLAEALELAEERAAADGGGPAVATADAPSWSEVQSALAGVVERRGPESSAGIIARYYQGVAQLRGGDTPGAAQTLSELVADHPRHHLTAQALALLATAQENAGDAAAAEATLRRLVDGDWPLYPRAAALMDLGRLQERQGRHDDARATYQRLTDDEDLSATPHASQARTRLEALDRL